MGLWWLLFACNLLIPAIMIFAGYWMWKHCPPNITPMWGYRTKRSMKNIDTWKFAHDYAGRLWWKVGWILMIPTVLVQLLFMKSSTNKAGILSLVIIFVQMLILLLTIIPVENALKKKFNDDGTVR